MKDENDNTAAKELWKRAVEIYLSSIHNEQDRTQAESYFSMVTSVIEKDGNFTAMTSKKFAADFLKEHYSEKIKSAISLAGGGSSANVDFIFDHQSDSSIIQPPKPASNTSRKTPDESTPTQKTTFTSTMPLDENYTFEEFVQGPSNSWAYSAAKGVTNNPGQKNYNPLFIHGGTGLGKTHLMQAIGHELKKKNPSMAVCYLTAETFLNEYVNTIQQKSGMDAFRDRYRKVDVLLVDDIQFLQRGKQCQEEFFNTFNDLTSNHKQIVMTSDVAPKNLPALEERLISRFEGGMVQEIESPNYETRLAILKKKAENMTPSIPTHTLEFLAENIRSHVRAMEGALSKVHIAISLNPAQDLSDRLLNELLKDFIEKEQVLKKLTIKEIKECVARKYSVSVEQILSSDRTQSLVTPRQLAMYISRKYTPKSLMEIAPEFGKTHATVLHGVKTIEKRLDVEEELRNSLSEILHEFGYSVSDKMMD
jgi:chromosomal replication initiator protein